MNPMNPESRRQIVLALRAQIETLQAIEQELQKYPEAPPEKLQRAANVLTSKAAGKMALAPPPPWKARAKKKATKRVVSAVTRARMSLSQQARHQTKKQIERGVLPKKKTAAPLSDQGL